MKVPALALAILPAIQATAQSVAVTGLDGHAQTFTAQQLAVLPQAQITLKAHGASHIYEGPTLLALLAKVGAPMGETLRGEDMADIVLVSASDGYCVALSLTEIDPSIRGEKVILADAADGKPLDAAEGPLRLVVEGDARPARSARMVTSVRLIRAR